MRDSGSLLSLLMIVVAAIGTLETVRTKRGGGRRLWLAAMAAGAATSVADLLVGVPTWAWVGCFAAMVTLIAWAHQIESPASSGAPSPFPPRELWDAYRPLRDDCAGITASRASELRRSLEQLDTVSAAGTAATAELVELLREEYASQPSRKNDMEIWGSAAVWRFVRIHELAISLWPPAAAADPDRAQRIWEMHRAWERLYRAMDLGDRPDRSAPWCLAPQARPWPIRRRSARPLSAPLPRSPRLPSRSPGTLAVRTATT
jgi:hypothetical protein